MTQSAAPLVDPSLGGFADLIACPCGEDLPPIDGRGACCANCGRSYRFSDGVLVCGQSEDPDGEDAALMSQEESVRDRQAELYDLVFGTSVPGLIESHWAHARIKELSRGTALDVGCGTGRMTLRLAQNNRRVVSVDRSMASLRRCGRKLAERGLAERVLLVKSDVNAVPVRGKAVDLAVSTQVVQHLPSVALREGCVGEIARCVRPGGSFVVSVYEWSDGPNFNREKQGRHKGGISYFRFTSGELRELLCPYFEVGAVTSCLGKLLFAVSGRRAE